MLTNATILRIDTPLPSKPGGGFRSTTGGAIAVRCCIAESNKTETLKDGDRLIEVVTTRLCVMPAALGSNVIVDRATVSILPDGGDAIDYRVWQSGPRPKGGISFIEAKLIEG